VWVIHNEPPPCSRTQTALPASARRVRAVLAWATACRHVFPSLVQKSIGGVSASAMRSGVRAGLETRQYLWTAREAEPSLGRMITAAREAGDLVGTGQRQGLVGGETLEDYGISFDLAAHSVHLAEVPDEVWAAWHEEDREPTRAPGRT
jgi:hypothetical protein